MDIFCDEAGHTGPDLLSPDQRFFAFSSIAIPDAEAAEIIRKARINHPVQMRELKASSLMHTERGRALVAAVLAECEGRYAVNVFEKLLALCCWMFEYIYEPVLQDDPWLLYEKNLHRFVAMYTWLWLNDASSDARAVVEQFQNYIRSLDPAEAPILFGTPRPAAHENEHPFEPVRRFAYGYREIIVADNARLRRELPEAGRWTLDLSTSALWSHLNHWGSHGKPLRVRCDESKPLRANAVALTGDENDLGIHRARRKGYTGKLGWSLAEPIGFVDSGSHLGIQIADIIAGATVFTARNRTPEFAGLIDALGRHVLPDTILPDMDIVNPATCSAKVSSFILFHLSMRAAGRQNPHDGLQEMYRAAELACARGEFG